MRSFQLHYETLRIHVRHKINSATGTAGFVHDAKTLVLKKVLYICCLTLNEM